MAISQATLDEVAALAAYDRQEVCFKLLTRDVCLHQGVLEHLALLREWATEHQLSDNQLTEVLTKLISESFNIHLMPRN